MELTTEKSAELAVFVKQIAESAREIDQDYLEAAINQMEANHSFRDSAMILNPNPHTAIETQDLSAQKIKGLKLMLELAKNQTDIFNAELKLLSAKQNSTSLSKLFDV